ncbi:MAG: FG-GAP repeat protein, partial [Spirosomaceae bacterium]|nr:FG-GAP repeat protein [Spirosomataceae bacterium]
VDMYRFVSGSWTFLREFTPTNVPDVDPAAFFGRAIALRGDLLVIGVPGEDNNTTADVGAIQAIRNSAGGTWTSSSMVTYSERMNPYLVANAQFGASVAVSTRSVMGGAPEYDDPASAITNVGLAAGFTNGTSYTHEKIENPSKSSGRQYGRSVAISDDGTFVIGAAPETSATWAGPGRVYFGNINL